MSRVGFIGLGNMGGPMANNLIKAGYELAIFDIVPSLTKSLGEAGATVSANARDVLQGAEFVISMLPASAHVEGLYLGSDGIMDSIDTSTLVIDCSTIAPASARKVATAAAEAGITMLDAPVSGGTGGAVNATLTFIVGGDEDALERARPILADLGKNIFHAGPAGAGQVAKICNNMLLAVQMSGTAEALQLGVANGLDPAVLSDIMKKSSGGNWALSTYNPYPGVMQDVPAANDYEGGFLVDLMLKDLGLAMESALDTGVSTPMGSLARNLYAAHASNGFGRKDFSSIQKFYK